MKCYQSVNADVTIICTQTCLSAICLRTLNYSQLLDIEFIINFESNISCFEFQKSFKTGISKPLAIANIVVGCFDGCLFLVELFWEQTGSNNTDSNGSSFNSLEDIINNEVIFSDGKTVTIISIPNKLPADTVAATNLVSSSRCMTVRIPSSAASGTITHISAYCHAEGEEDFSFLTKLMCNCNDRSYYLSSQQQQEVVMVVVGFSSGHVAWTVLPKPSQSPSYAAISLSLFHRHTSPVLDVQLLDVVDNNSTYDNNNSNDVVDNDMSTSRRGHRHLCVLQSQGQLTFHGLRRLHQGEVSVHTTCTLPEGTQYPLIPWYGEGGGGGDFLYVRSGILYLTRPVFSEREGASRSSRRDRTLRLSPSTRVSPEASEAISHAVVVFALAAETSTTLVIAYTSGQTLVVSASEYSSTLTITGTGTENRTVNVEGGFQVGITSAADNNVGGGEGLHTTMNHDEMLRKSAALSDLVSYGKTERLTRGRLLAVDKEILNLATLISYSSSSQSSDGLTLTSLLTVKGTLRRHGTGTGNNTRNRCENRFVYDIELSTHSMCLARSVHGQWLCVTWQQLQPSLLGVEGSLEPIQSHSSPIDMVTVPRDVSETGCSTYIHKMGVSVSIDCISDYVVSISLDVSFLSPAVEGLSVFAQQAQTSAGNQQQYQCPSGVLLPLVVRRISAVEVLDATSGLGLGVCGGALHDEGDGEGGQHSLGLSMYPVSPVCSTDVSESGITRRTSSPLHTDRGKGQVQTFLEKRMNGTSDVNNNSNGNGNGRHMAFAFSLPAETGTGAGTGTSTDETGDIITARKLHRVAVGGSDSNCNGTGSRGGHVGVAMEPAATMLMRSSSREALVAVHGEGVRENLSAIAAAAATCSSIATMSMSIGSLSLNSDVANMLALPADIIPVVVGCRALRKEIQGIVSSLEKQGGQGQEQEQGQGQLDLFLRSVSIVDSLWHHYSKLREEK
eukprot:gene8283-17039_t